MHDIREIREIYNISNVVKDFEDTLYINKIYCSTQRNNCYYI